MGKLDRYWKVWKFDKYATQQRRSAFTTLLRLDKPFKLPGIDYPLFWLLAGINCIHCTSHITCDRFKRLK